MLLDYMGEFSRRFTLDRERTALVVVDMQYATGSRTEGLGKQLELSGRPEVGAERFDFIEEMVPRLVGLLGEWRRRGLPVVYVVTGSSDESFRDVPAHMRSFMEASDNRVGTRSHDVLDELKPLPEDSVIRKTTISAFSSTGIESLVRAMGRDQLVFAGISTNMCVDSTARDAADRGFDCVLLENCRAAAQRAFHDAALITFGRLFGIVQSSQDALAQL